MENVNIEEVVAKAVREAVADMTAGGSTSLANNDELRSLLAIVQDRLDEQRETSLRLVEEVKAKDAAMATIDYVAVTENITEFKDTIEQCNQTMDQLRKQLNRERNNNDRTITELYRSMKYSEERIEELHANYDEFTTVINSHKNIMSILVWLNIIVIVALIIISLLGLLK
jgi:chromosome segregation ATPase